MTAFTSFHDPIAAIPPRPRSLIRAANAGQSGWRRERHLAKLLKCEHCPTPGDALPRLLAEEAKQNEARQMRAPYYDIKHHVLLMIALLAEIRMISAQPLNAPGKESPKHP